MISILPAKDNREVLQFNSSPIIAALPLPTPPPISVENPPLPAISLAKRIEPQP
jgi:hypothetical protein